MTSLIYNPNANNQLRFVTLLHGDDYQIPNDDDAEAAGLRDVERERDAVVSVSWVYTVAPGAVFTVSPFYHYNRANYQTIRRSAQRNTGGLNTRARRRPSRP